METLVPVEASCSSCLYEHNCDHEVRPCFAYAPEPGPAPPGAACHKCLRLEHCFERCRPCMNFAVNSSCARCVFLDSCRERVKPCLRFTAAETPAEDETEVSINQAHSK